MSERYINLSDRQVKDTQNQSQDFLSIKTICRLLNNQDQQIFDLEAKLAESEKENKRLSKNLRISWTKRMQFYNGLLINKLRDVRDKLDKELFDGYYEKDISVGSVKVVVGAVFDQQINDLRSK